MNKRIVCTVLMISVALVAFGDNIVLKDGSIYEGYVSSQSFGSDSKCIISYSQFTKNISVDDIVESGNVIKYNIKELNQKWEKWAESNEVIEKSNGEKYLSLTRMTIKGQAARDFFILERGTEFLKCFTISDGKDECNTSEIHCVIKEAKSPYLLTAVDDVVKTETESYIGTILEQYPGVQIKIKSNRDNEIHVVNYKDIKTIGKVEFNKSYSIWEQAPFLDKIYLRNGQVKTGLIIENGLEGGYNLIFALKDEESSMQTQQLSYNDLIKTEKIENIYYKPEYDVNLQDGESRINHDSLIEFVSIEEYNYKGMFKFFYVMPDTDNIPIVNSNHVIIETKGLSNSDIFVFKERKINAVDSSKKKRTKVSLSGFTYGDMVESPINVSYKVTINGTSKIEFDVNEPGRYFVYLRNQRKCWSFYYNN